MPRRRRLVRQVVEFFERRYMCQNAPSPDPSCFAPLFVETCVKVREW